MADTEHHVDIRWQQDRRELLLAWLREHWDACFLIALILLIVGMVVVCLCPTPQRQLSLQRYVEAPSATAIPLSQGRRGESGDESLVSETNATEASPGLKPEETTDAETGGLTTPHTRKRTHFPKYHKKSEHPSVTSLNTGLAAQLEQLPGIGPKMAERIIAYRKAHGAFTDLEQLKDVKGIGDKKFEKIKPFIKL